MKLDVRPYCDCCPEFTPEVEFGERLYDGGEVFTMGETTVRCLYRKRCENMVRYLQKQMEKPKD